MPNAEAKRAAEVINEKLTLSMRQQVVCVNGRILESVGC